MKLIYKPNIKIVKGLYTVDPDDVKLAMFNGRSWYAALNWCRKMNRKKELQKEIKEYVYGSLILRYN